MKTLPTNSNECSTEFSLWLREQEETDSRLGYVATSIDYVWKDHKTGQWMLIEEKRYGAHVKQWQVQMFNMLDECARSDSNYRGFHYIIFENTGPDDGYIRLDGEIVTKEELLSFLQFDKF